MKKLAWIAVLSLAGCCVTTEQHKTLTEAFDEYVEKTAPLVEAKAKSLEGDAAGDALADGWRKFLRDGRKAVQEHKELAGIAPVGS